MNAANADTMFQGLMEELSAALSDAIQLMETGSKDSTATLRQIDKTLAQAVGAFKSDNTALVAALTNGLKNIKIEVSAPSVPQPVVNVTVQPAQVVMPKTAQAKGWQIKFELSGSGMPLGAKMTRID